MTRPFFCSWFKPPEKVNLEAIAAEHQARKREDRLHRELLAMEAEKNTVATLAHERHQQLVGMRSLFKRYMAAVRYCAGSDFVSAIRPLHFTPEEHAELTRMSEPSVASAPEAPSEDIGSIREALEAADYEIRMNMPATARSPALAKIKKARAALKAIVPEKGEVS